MEVVGLDVRYKTDLYGSYAMILIPQGIDRNKYAFKMLENNRIKGVCSCHERIEDGESYFYLDISGKKNLWQEYQDREMELPEMIWLFQNIVQISEELRNYLLSERMLWLDPEFIYKDMEDGSISIVVIPWEKELKYPLRKLAEFLLEKVNHEDENSVNAAYHFYRQQSQTNFCLAQFLPVLEKENISKRKKENSKEETMSGAADYKIEEHKKEADSGRNIKEEQNSTQEYKQEDEFIKDEILMFQNEKNSKLWIGTTFASILISALVFVPFIEKNQKVSCISLSICLFITGLCIKLYETYKNKKEITVNKSLEYGGVNNDTYNEYNYEEPGETVFFESVKVVESLKLRWKEKGKKREVELRDLPFTVGKKKEEVSLILPDPSVSRLHCRFVEKAGGVAIMDLDSTNGTSLNGIKLKTGEVLEIVKNDEILVGNIRLLVV